MNLEESELEILLDECNQQLHEEKEKEWNAIFQLKLITEKIQNIKDERDFLRNMLNAHLWNMPISGTLNSTLDKSDVEKLSIIGSISKRYKTSHRRNSTLENIFKEL